MTVPPAAVGYPDPMPLERLLTLDQGWVAPEERPLCLIDLETTASDPHLDSQLMELLRTIPCVTIGVTAPKSPHDPLYRLIDLILPLDDPRLAQAVHTIHTNPIASISLAVLMRAQVGTEPRTGIVLESAAYSALQAGREFSAWRRARPSKPPDPHTNSRVQMTIEEGELKIRLVRPDRHNAIDRQMRQELYDALMVASTRTEPVRLDGVGPSFSSGGDLDEFGSFTDPAAAHVLRLAAHPALAMLSLPPSRLTARVHGHCLGGGLEIAAFAGRVEASATTVFGLPETRLGLVPGAGGTVSLTARIGPRRVLELALCHDTIDAETAHEWGLVDILI